MSQTFEKYYKLRKKLIGLTIMLLAITGYTIIYTVKLGEMILSMNTAMIIVDAFFLGFISGVLVLAHYIVNSLRKNKYQS